MPDMEKVIKGLERCLVCNLSVLASEEEQKAYIDCEYTTGLYCRHDMLIRDAIALLKSQPEIVRCKDCKHYEKDPYCEGFGDCQQYSARRG